MHTKIGGIIFIWCYFASIATRSKCRLLAVIYISCAYRCCAGFVFVFSVSFLSTGAAEHPVFFFVSIMCIAISLLLSQVRFIHHRPGNPSEWLWHDGIAVYVAFWRAMLIIHIIISTKSSAYTYQYMLYAELPDNWLSSLLLWSSSRTVY